MFSRIHTDRQERFRLAFASVSFNELPRGTHALFVLIGSAFGIGCGLLRSGEVKVTATGLTKQQQQRVAAHSHIRSLGLAADGTALPQGGGMVGQLEAREAAGIIVELIKAGKLAGECCTCFCVLSSLCW